MQLFEVVSPRAIFIGLAFTGLVLWQSHAANPPKRLTHCAPESIGLLPGSLARIDEAVNTAVQRNELPGAVVLVARQGRIGYFKAFGSRALQPNREAMTLDTVFDIASLTKVMATAPSIMLLVERGKVRLGDKVKRYLPKFIGYKKEDITVSQLLTHYSGLAADFDLSKRWEGYEEALNQLWKEKTVSEPGKEFSYSDLNYVALGEIVRSVSGKRLDEFARENIFQPLGMKETTFLPPPSWRPRTAPTEPRSNTLQYLKGAGAQSQEILRGEVHDPTTWLMNGVAGHAGLFSTAEDIAVFLQTMLNEGSWSGFRLLSPITVHAMTSPQNPPNSTILRGFGWDIYSTYSAPRGDLLSGGYGHSGFTGTSVWVSPEHGLFIIILSNRIHPDGKGDVTHIRGVIANIVAASIADGIKQ